MIKMCYLGINSCTLKFVGLDIALQELGEHAPRPAQLRECCRLSIGQTNCWQCWEILKVLDLLGYKILVLENPPNKHTKSGQKMFTPNWWEVCVFMWCPLLKLRKTSWYSSLILDDVAITTGALEHTSHEVIWWRTPVMSNPIFSRIINIHYWRISSINIVIGSMRI